MSDAAIDGSYISLPRTWLKKFDITGMLGEVSITAFDVLTPIQEINAVSL